MYTWYIHTHIPRGKRVVEVGSLPLFFRYLFMFFPIVVFGSEKNKVCLPYKCSKSSRIKSLICVHAPMYMYGAKGEYIIYYYYNAP